MDMVDLDETLIVVTADHSHTMTINGYPTRGNDILGLAGISDVDQSPYTTLSYANGPSSKKKDVKRYDFSKDNLSKFTKPCSRCAGGSKGNCWL
ncbi:alkaline phosphatase-like [Diaphorina citri]|jgi:Alkaline phosphatase|uniref:alkaline phosphatase n=1 Tax=Diaphorina citri TaxID=121845 RepID=A0A3Q0IYD8_DIACI|nr:alkaline phosphatase-like [Diaphorina citri]